MNIADLGTLLKIYEDMPLSTRIHLRGFLTQCTPHTAKILRELHGGEKPLEQFLEKMRECGIEIPGVVPGPLPGGSNVLD